MGCQISRVQPDGDIDEKANEILKQELTAWKRTTYKEIRKLHSEWYGFTDKYLTESANYRDFSSSAEISTLLKLAELDLSKGATIGELIFSCCQCFPNQEAIKSLIELGKQSQSEEQVIKQVFEFRSQNGANCLSFIFHMATWYRIKNKGKHPFGPMLVDIEESFQYLIELAKSANLDLDEILSHTDKNGETLFFQALIYSVKITEQLLIINDQPGRIDAEANEILKQELIALQKETYDEIRLDPNPYGFTSKYLCELAVYEDFSSSAKTSTLLTLAILDLQKGTSIGELVYSCCKWFPNKEAIKSLIEIGKQSKSEGKVVNHVFEFQNEEGFKCLNIIFTMAIWYGNSNKKYPSGPLLAEIEETCFYLIQQAKSANLDLDKILNHTTKGGDTLFSAAAMYSEKITIQLLMETNAHQENVVRVNSINDLFETPFFRVRSKFF